MIEKIKIEVPIIFFKCKILGVYPCTELISLRLSRCGSCGECECALPRIVFPKVIEDERWLTKEDGSMD
jgi:hypothetical protein